MNNGDFTCYQGRPEAFAREVLGSKWWSAQREVAEALCNSRRVAVKAANGVGKTYLAADLLLWFLYSYPGAVVLTTAPTWRQVESLLWEEARRRHRTASWKRSEKGLSPLGGAVLKTQLKLGDGHFAIGLSTDEPVRFQGYHAENLLVIIDEACGIDDKIWDAVEGICVGANNRVLAISNPLLSAGVFYDLFQNPRWTGLTISGLDHPNVIENGALSPIPGAVTRVAIEDRLVSWCDKVGPEAETEIEPGSFVWSGTRYQPNDQFRMRVMGHFPGASEDSLVSRDVIARAQAPVDKNLVNDSKANSNGERAEEESGTTCALAIDVARFGADETAFALRRGNRICWVKTFFGSSTTETTRRAQEFARLEGADYVLVDETGVGGGVMDQLADARTQGLIGVQFGGKPMAMKDVEVLNVRAEIYWRLKLKLESGTLKLPDDSRLAEQLAAVRYDHDEFGRIRLESKRELKKRGEPSPDRADAVAMLMHPIIDRHSASLLHERAMSATTAEQRSW